MSEKEVWHCVYCGRHWVGGPPTITARIVGKDHPLRCCPFCHEYKGLEVCDPKICKCWELAYVRDLFHCTDCLYFNPPPDVERCYEGDFIREICKDFRGKGG